MPRLDIFLIMTTLSYLYVSNAQIVASNASIQRSPIKLSELVSSFNTDHLKETMDINRVRLADFELKASKQVKAILFPLFEVKSASGQESEIGFEESLILNEVNLDGKIIINNNEEFVGYITIFKHKKKHISIRFNKSNTFIFRKPPNNELHIYLLLDISTLDCCEVYEGKLQYKGDIIHGIGIKLKKTKRMSSRIIKTSNNGKVDKYNLLFPEDMNNIFLYVEITEDQTCLLWDTNIHEQHVIINHIIKNDEENAQKSKFPKSIEVKKKEAQKIECQSVKGDREQEESSLICKTKQLKQHSETLESESLEDATGVNKQETIRNDCELKSAEVDQYTQPKNTVDLSEDEHKNQLHVFCVEEEWSDDFTPKEELHVIKNDEYLKEEKNLKSICDKPIQHPNKENTKDSVCTAQNKKKKHRNKSKNKQKVKKEESDTQ
ncbi:hypothetical protein CDIK_3435 [Cucumispora dikerogammari]|nr:hypothetical protein CDIK_3435 [Cucumispora dikerogammari]